MTIKELRGQFIIDDLFANNKIPMVGSDVDRSITGSVMPVGKELIHISSKKEMAADYFAQRRSEIYMYFNLRRGSTMMHILGDLEETRNIIMRIVR